MPMLDTSVAAAPSARHLPSSPGRPPRGHDTLDDADAAPIARFSAAERNRLLLERGIGPTLVSRLERAGFSSIAALRQAGADRVVDAIAEALDAPGWRNRLRALDRVIHQARA